MLEILPSHLRPSSPLDALTPEAVYWLFRAGASPEAFASWSEEEPPSNHPFNGFWADLLVNTHTKRQLAQALEAEGGAPASSPVGAG